MQPSRGLVLVVAFVVLFHNVAPSRRSNDFLNTIRNAIQTDSNCTVVSDKAPVLAGKLCIQRLLRIFLLKLDGRNRFENMKINNHCWNIHGLNNFDELLDSDPMHVHVKKYLNFSEISSKTWPKITKSLLTLGLDMEKYICGSGQIPCNSIIRKPKDCKGEIKIDAVHDVVERVRRHYRHHINDEYSSRIAYINRLQCIGIADILKDVQRELHRPTMRDSNILLIVPQPDISHSERNSDFLIENSRHSSEKGSQNDSTTKETNRSDQLTSSNNMEDNVNLNEEHSLTSTTLISTENPDFDHSSLASISHKTNNPHHKTTKQSRHHAHHSIHTQAHSTQTAVIIQDGKMTTGTDHPTRTGSHSHNKLQNAQPVRGHSVKPTHNQEHNTRVNGNNNHPGKTHAKNQIVNPLHGNEQRGAENMDHGKQRGNANRDHGKQRGHNAIGDHIKTPPQHQTDTTIDEHCCYRYEEYPEQTEHSRGDRHGPTDVNMHQDHIHLSTSIAKKTESLASVVVQYILEGYRLHNNDMPCPVAFVKDILQKSGNGQYITKLQLQSLYNEDMKKDNSENRNSDHSTSEHKHSDTHKHSEKRNLQHFRVPGGDNQAMYTNTALQNQDLQLKKVCYNFTNIEKIFELPPRITASVFIDVCPALFHRLVNENCAPPEDKLTPTQTVVTAAEKYGFGTLCVLIISLCSLGGLVFIKCLVNTGKTLMPGLIALSVGCLLGDGILHLLPHVLHDHSHDSSESADKHSIYKLCGALASIYVFFLLELFFCRSHTHDDHNFSLISVSKSTNDTAMDFKLNNLHEPKQENTAKNVAWRQVSTNSAEKESDTDSAHKIMNDNKGTTSLAWMILIGELIHNFADGLAIGAAFSENLTEGLSTSLAVFCHELPHELGDFAALLSTGMSTKKAALLNFVSGVSAFVGLYIGIVVGSDNHTRMWIFSFAAGMFIYVALANLIPQLLNNFRRNDNLRMFLSLNIGLLTGFTSMLLLAIYEDKIKFTV